jgi:hypothetical protein
VVGGNVAEAMVDGNGIDEMNPSFVVVELGRLISSMLLLSSLLEATDRHDELLLFNTRALGCISIAMGAVTGGTMLMRLVHGCHVFTWNCEHGGGTVLSSIEVHSGNGGQYDDVSVVVAIMYVQPLWCWWGEDGIQNVGLALVSIGMYGTVLGRQVAGGGSSDDSFVEDGVKLKRALAAEMTLASSSSTFSFVIANSSQVGILMDDGGGDGCVDGGEYACDWWKDVIPLVAIIRISWQYWVILAMGM